MILNNFYCTKEILIILLKSEYLALKHNNYFIMPIHLMLSLLLTNNLCSKLLNINNNLINNKIISKLLKKYKYNINITNIIFSNKVIDILIKLNQYNFKINSLNLLLLLLDNIDIDIKYLFKYLNITSLNTNILNYINIYNINIFPNNLINKLNKIANKINNINNNYLKNNFNFYKLQYNKLLQILNLKIKKHIIIKGNKNIDKLIILQLLHNNIKYKLVPNYLYKTEIWILKLNLLNFNVHDIILNIINISKNLIDYKLILVIKNIELFVNNTTEENKNILIDNKLYYLNILLSEISNYNINIIIIINNFEYKLYFKNTEILESFFYDIEINELNKLQTFLFIKNNINNYINYYNININNYIIYELINLSKKYIKTSVLPKTPLILLENLCSKQYLLNKKNINKYYNFKYSYTYKNILINSEKNNNITIEHIKDVISEYLNLSKINIFKNYKIIKNNLNNLSIKLYKNIYGQDHIINNILPSIKQNFIGLKNKNKPIGSWILCGPSGTGKTELAKILAKELYGSEQKLIRFDMSEYMEKHSISKLIGSPPGYIGYSEGGQLTDKIKKNPNAIILFDEIEKAHIDIYNIMLQILDEGRLTDSMGNLIDFSNTIILLTSNLGCPINYDKYFINKEILIDSDLKEIENNIKININNYFKPEFLNRLTNILIFKPLNINNLLLICDKFINELKNKLYINKLNLNIYINNEIKYILTKLSYNPLYGARPLKRNLELIIEKSINDLLLNFNKNYFDLNNNFKYILHYFINKYYNLNYNIYLL
nr:molecular chaperone [Haemoproteus columbae]